MVESSSISITPASHAEQHRHGGDDPLTGEVLIDNVPTAFENNAEVFSGASPAAYADLDLSAIVGAVRALVVLEVYSNQNSVDDCYTFRPKGSTYDYHQTVAGLGLGGCSVVDLKDNAASPEAGIAICITDSSGFVQWYAATGGEQTKVVLLGYIILA